MSKLAVIGSGISGIFSAYLLSKKYDVTLFESEDRLGGHTNTYFVTDPERGRIGIDTGFIVFNAINYPIFSQFLNELGVESQDSDMSFGYYLKNPEFWYCSDFPQGFFSQLKHVISPKQYTLLWEISRFNCQATRDFYAKKLQGMSLESYLKHHQFSEFFKNVYLLPMCSAIWSAHYDTILKFPIQNLLSFWINHRLLQFFNRPTWKTISGGSQCYIDAFLRQFPGKLFLSCPISSVSLTPHAVKVVEQSGLEHDFDKVVIATHADQALRLRVDPTDNESKWLGAWRYSNHTVVLHSDTKVLPPKKTGWASWTAHQDSEQDTTLQLTYVMNRLQKLTTKKPYLVTLNPGANTISPPLIHKTFSYTHPIFTQESMDTQSNLQYLNQQGQIFYCGSYFGYGFHEDGAASALQVAKLLGVSWPQ